MTNLHKNTQDSVDNWHPKIVQESLGGHVVVVGKGDGGHWRREIQSCRWLSLARSRIRSDNTFTSGARRM